MLTLDFMPSLALSPPTFAPSSLPPMAAAALCHLAASANISVSIAAAGAIPLLVPLLMPGSVTDAKEYGAAALANLADNPWHAVAITIAGAISPLVQLMGPGYSDEVRGHAAAALGRIAGVAESASTIAAAGAVPPLVQLLRPGLPAKLQRRGIAALHALAANAAIAVAIAATADAIFLLVQLMGPRSDDHTRGFAQQALMALGDSNAEIHATIDAAFRALVMLERQGMDIRE
jgi:hypothetical protein